MRPDRRHRCLLHACFDQYFTEYSDDVAPTKSQIELALDSEQHTAKYVTKATSAGSLGFVNEGGDFAHNHAVESSSFAIDAEYIDISDVYDTKIAWNTKTTNNSSSIRYSRAC